MDLIEKKGVGPLEVRVLRTADGVLIFQDATAPRPAGSFFRELGYVRLPLLFPPEVIAREQSEGS